MTDKEYCEWAKEYRTAVSQMNEIIDKLTKQSKAKTVSSLERIELRLAQLREMRRECEKTEKLLLNKAEHERTRRRANVEQNDRTFA